MQNPYLKMEKLIQTRLHSKKVKGNCFPTVIACLMNLGSPEHAIQIQERMDNPDWVGELDDWLIERNYSWQRIDGHLYHDEFYMVIGKTKRFPKINHVCIYQNGKLYHDPHPDGVGLITEEEFEIISRIPITETKVMEDFPEWPMYPGIDGSFFEIYLEHFFPPGTVLSYWGSRFSIFVEPYHEIKSKKFGDEKIRFKHTVSFLSDEKSHFLSRNLLKKDSRYIVE